MDATPLLLLLPLLLLRKRDSVRFESGVQATKITSPVKSSDLLRYGQSLMADRGNKAHTKHSGLDIFVKQAGVPVIAIGNGVILRKMTQICEGGKPCAGLFIDLKLETGIIARYLHLGSASVTDGQKVTRGQSIGTVAKTGTSGLGSAPPHLHFELRRSDWQNGIGYGTPIDPRPLIS